MCFARLKLCSDGERPGDLCPSHSRGDRQFRPSVLWRTHLQAPAIDFDLRSSRIPIDTADVASLRSHYDTHNTVCQLPYVMRLRLSDARSTGTRARMRAVPCCSTEVMRPVRIPLFGFPDVILHAEELAVKKSSYYPAAKGGDADAADLLVADMGGTLANLIGYIESQGGHAVGATVLTGKPYSAMVAPDDLHIQALRDRHGREFEDWWRETFGFGFDCLTRSEARYLENSPDAQTIRDRLTAAGFESRSGPTDG
jgi:hypothetical protein